MAEDCIESFDFGVGVDAFIEPGVFELVRCNHAVPILVAELMSDGLFCDVSGVAEPGGAAGDESRVLHAADLGVGFGIDDGEGLVGVGAVVLLEEGETLLGDVEIARAGGGVSGKAEDVDLHRAE